MDYEQLKEVIGHILGECVKAYFEEELPKKLKEFAEQECQTFAKISGQGMGEQFTNSLEPFLAQAIKDLKKIADEQIDKRWPKIKELANEQIDKRLPGDLKSFVVDAGKNILNEMEFETEVPLFKIPIPFYKTIWIKRLVTIRPKVKG